MNDETDKKKPELNLVGQDGNAFQVLALAQRAAKKAGWSPETIRQFMDEAASGDYDHLLQTVMRWFDVH